MAELLDEHVEDHGAQTFLVERGRGAAGGRGPRVREEGELRHLARELGHDVLGLLGPDPGQAAQVGFVLPGDGGSDVAHRRGERARGHQGPTSFTVISFSKNSLSSSEVKPMSTGRG